jgi:hypothetical protein
MTFKGETSGAQADALKWAEESVELNLSTMREMVSKVAGEEQDPYDAQQFVTDATKLMLGAQRDMARMMNLWGQFATALAKVELE